jgi:hypothetical protein
LASRIAIFSCSRSRSISAAPSLAFSRSLSNSSPHRALILIVRDGAAHHGVERVRGTGVAHPKIAERDLIFVVVGAVPKRDERCWDGGRGGWHTGHSRRSSGWRYQSAQVESHK